jgi:uncharacterized protein (TIGR02996 family)
MGRKVEAIRLDKSFQQALAQDPDDEATRLIYADWLEERGEDGKATFLRSLWSVRTRLPAADAPGYEEQLALRESLHDYRAVVDWRWSRAVGDPGLVGHVVCRQLPGHRSGSWLCLIVGETPRTLRAAWLHHQEAGRMRGWVNLRYEAEVTAESIGVDFVLDDPFNVRKLRGEFGQYRNTGGHHFYYLFRHEPVRLPA